MSYTPSITNELIRDKSLKANTKILLLVLMTYENKEGFAYPSQPRLIEETGLSKNTLLKCLNELEEKGYIKRVKEKGENNKYYINSSIKIDTSTSIKINTSEDITSIKNDTRGSIKIDTLEVLNTSNKKEKENKKSNTNILLLLLMTYENKEVFAYPSQPRLIEETGLSKNTLLKCLN